MLTPYLLRDAGLIDSHEWWINTTDVEDIAYLEALSAERPDFFRTVEVKAPCSDVGWKRCRRLMHFYPRCMDPGTIYIKLDDDICYIAPEAVRELLQFRVDNPFYFLTYANTINSPLNTHIHQRIGALPLSCGAVEYSPSGNAWSDPGVAALAHETFLRDLDEGREGRWQFERWEMPRPEHFSINFCAWFGSDLRRFDGWVRDNDEVFLALDAPARLGRPNAVCGRALVSHFAFQGQRPVLEQSDLLDGYRRHSALLQEAQQKA